MPRLHISDEQFARIEHLLPGKATDRGVTARDNRLFIDAVLWIDRAGAPWRDLPERFGKWNSCLPAVLPVGRQGRLGAHL